MEKCEKCGKDKKVLFTSLYCDCTATTSEVWDLYTEGVVCDHCGAWAFYIDADNTKDYTLIGFLVENSSMQFTDRELESTIIACQYCKMPVAVTATLKLPYSKWLPRRISG